MLNFIPQCPKCGGLGVHAPACPNNPAGDPPDLVLEFDHGDLKEQLDRIEKKIDQIVNTVWIKGDVTIGMVKHLIKRLEDLEDEKE